MALNVGSLISLTISQTHYSWKTSRDATCYNTCHYS